jgi:two-component system sensor histidine kinase VicK
VILIKSKEKHFPMLEVSSPIELAINNLIHNAVKYSLSGTSDEPRKVMISGEPSGAYYKISIKDYGVPIPADEYDKVFEDGYQSATAKEVFPTGMGRGLHVAKTIISRHHGTIRVFSNQEEGGFSTTVEMYLPYNQPTPKVGS